jgi:hypothetical protein
MKLTAENVEKVLVECLFADIKEAEENKPVIAEGIMRKMGFHPGRLEANRENITSMLSELPDAFQKKGGGGMSFLNMCNTKDGNQWADLHQTMENLVLLGVAIGKVSYPMPRDIWPDLPGGVPYIVVN